VRTAIALAALLALDSTPAAAQCPRNEAAAALALQADTVTKVNIDDAIAKYTRALELDGQNHVIWWKLALAYERKEDWNSVANACAKAEEAAEHAEGKKTHADYYVLHGRALAELASSDPAHHFYLDAEGRFEIAIQIDPNYAEAYGELAHAEALGDYEESALRTYTEAIRRAPERTAYYVELADLYRRLLLFSQEERVLRAGISVAREGDKHLFNLNALLGDALEMKQDFAGAVDAYEAAKRSCDGTKCSDHREAYFYLGVAYAEVNPPRKSEAMQQMQSFWKMICKGALAKKYADQCAQAQEVVRRVGGTLQ
jgi:tetratricopeptide (TPR) repeat protein